MPAILREFVSSLDDKVWQTELYKLLQSQSFNQVEVDLFELLCKVLDHNLFAQVDWARNSYYFKELKVGFFYTLDLFYRKHIKVFRYSGLATIHFKNIILHIPLLAEYIYPYRIYVNKTLLTHQKRIFLADSASCLRNYDDDNVLRMHFRRPISLFSDVI